MKQQSVRSHRLQRPRDFTGDQIQSFSAVFIRHGLPCALLGLLFLTDATIWPLLKSATTAARENNTLYLISAGLIFLGLIAHVAIGKYPLDLGRAGKINPAEIKYSVLFSRAAAVALFNNGHIVASVKNNNPRSAHGNP